jgi:SWI/SNF-related matrix-associated actin-dependent regulator 1 of chromatin subfamily A
VLQVELDGQHVLLTVDMRGPLAHEAKTLGFANFRDGRLRYGVEASPGIVRFADRYGLLVDPKLRAAAAKIAAEPDVDIFRGTIKVIHDKTKHLPNLTDTVPIAIHRDDKKSRNYWTAPLSESARITAWADQLGLRVSDAVRQDAQTRWIKELEAFNLSSSLTADEAPVITGLVSTLQPIQIPPIVMLHTSRKMLCADVPGLGKSLETLAAARVEDAESKRLVIVCPSGLTANWLAEMSTHFEPGTFTPWIAESRTPSDIPADVDVVVVGWAVLEAWVDTLSAWKPDYLAVDEGHYAKSGKIRTKTEKKPTKNKDGHVEFVATDVKVSGSARGSAIVELAKETLATKGLIMVLTGTPMVNRPLELLALIELLGIENVFGGSVSYKNHFCDPKEVRVSHGRGFNGTKIEYKGATNLRELNTRLRTSGFYMRRTKESWIEAGSLKKKYVDGAYFYDKTAKRRPKILRLSADAMAEYNEAKHRQTEFFSAYAQELMRGNARIQYGSQAMNRKIAAKGSSELNRIGELRQLAAKAKIPSVLARARGLIAEGEKVVIAAHHKDVVDAYAEALGGLKIQGGMSPKKIEEQKLLFNSRPIEEYPAIILSAEACKAGHTLCLQEQLGAGPACRHMIFAEQIWVPGDEEQIQDRIWRFGQPREVFIENALLEGTFDMDIYYIRENKRQNINVAIDAAEETSTGDPEKSGAGHLALKLFQQRQR